MENLREYVITVTDNCHLDSLYDDLETPGGCECVPEREVECCRRRPILASTIYSLTNEEAEQLKLDERVLDVEDKEYLDRIERRLHFEQSSNSFDKGAGQDPNDINWALLRCVEGQNRYAWGADGFASQTGIVTTTSTGKHVDIVIVDDLVDPNHPEFAVNADGTGGSRVVQYNWYQHNPEVTGGSAGNYDYNLSGANSHGTHVAGTAAGNTQGWARDANIYNIHFNRDDVAETFGYILAWHNSKSINPKTGHKNPTVINNSWGASFTWHRVSSLDPNEREYVTWRGTRYDGPFSDDDLESFGLMEYTSSGGELGNGTIKIPAVSNSARTSLEALIDAGCLISCSAGNGRMLIRGPGLANDLEANNSYYGYAFFLGQFRHQLGTGSYQYGNMISNSCSQALTVGATNSAVVDAKRSFSDCGPSVEVYSPGTNIQSAHLYADGVSVPDPRNSNYHLKKQNGTSMASPQVAGVLACLCETYPRLTAKSGFSAFNKKLGNNNSSYYAAKYQSVAYENGQFVTPSDWIFDGPFASDLHDWITDNWSRDQLLDTGGGYTDENSLQGGPNVYLKYIQAREFEGVNTPRTKYWNRPTFGNVWPRRSLTVYGRN